jgi:hypothetical protein
MQRVLKVMPISILCISLSLFLLAGCGSNPSGSSASASGTSTACTQATRPATAFKTSIGTLKSISGQTLIVTDTQGKSVTVTYSSSTTFTQEVKIAAGNLKEGTSVRVTVTSSGNAYTAVSILASTGTSTGTSSGFGGAPGARGGGNGSNPCFANRGRGSATPGTGNSSFRGIAGTVSQVNGTTLIITDTAGASYTVTLTAQTQIIETKSATAAVLKVGESLAAVGKPGSQNAVAASTIAVLLSLPTRGTPTSAPAA